MPTEVSVVLSGDANGQVLQTTTEEAFSAIPNPAGARQFQITHTDGKWTAVKEEWVENGSAYYSVEASTSTEPIESHPRFDSIRNSEELQKWSRWKSNPDDPKLAGWLPQYSSEALIHDLYWWFVSGITTYLAPRVTIKITGVFDNPPDVSGVGKTANPGEAFGWTGNFLLVGCSAQQEGTKYRTSFEYLGSAAGTTWDNDLYT